ncbi:MAG: hypothetical protein LBE18_10250 [Planctomycetaceae bacterium]|jgi:phosphomannomutase/phosphoglucomutase|nr:hypothetical protein [Planctomycetaceae bacterium]
MSSNIYRHDHILGLVDGGLSAELYRSWGYAIGQMVPSGSLLIVTSDVRDSSVPFKSALIEGLLSAGIKVIDIGLLPADLAMYAKDNFSAVGFVCVGGDWHSSEWNGLRWYIDGTKLSISEQVMRLQEIASNPPVIDLAAVHLSMHELFRKRDITFHWIAWSQNIWHDANQRAMRILIDPMHGSWSQLAGKALQAIFPQVSIETIRDFPIDNFGGVIPNSRIDESIITTRNAAKNLHVDLAVALDADAGKFTIIDNEGNPLSVEEMQWLFIRNLLCDALDGECLLHDSACSEVLLNESIRLGATPIVSGMTLERFLDDMRQMKAFFGIMSDGMMFFRGTGGCRIVVLAISWLIDYMLCTTFKLSEWRKTLPAFYITPELCVDYSEVEEIVNHLSEEWSSKPIETIDGYCFSGTAARVHIRSMRGYEQIKFRFESKNKDGLDNLVHKSSIALSNFGKISSSLTDQYKKCQIK